METTTTNQQAKKNNYVSVSVVLRVLQKVHISSSWRAEVTWAEQHLLTIHRCGRSVRRPTNRVQYSKTTFAINWSLNQNADSKLMTQFTSNMGHINCAVVVFWPQSEQ